MSATILTVPSNKIAAIGKGQKISVTHIQGRTVMVKAFNRPPLTTADFTMGAAASSIGEGETREFFAPEPGWTFYAIRSTSSADASDVKLLVDEMPMPPESLPPVTRNLVGVFDALGGYQELTAAAATTRAVADGDPVGCILDSAGLHGGIQAYGANGAAAANANRATLRRGANSFGALGPDGLPKFPCLEFASTSCLASVDNLATTLAASGFTVYIITTHPLSTGVIVSCSGNTAGYFLWNSGAEFRNSFDAGSIRVFYNPTTNQCSPSAALGVNPDSTIAYCASTQPVDANNATVKLTSAWQWFDSNSGGNTKAAALSTQLSGKMLFGNSHTGALSYKAKIQAIFVFSGEHSADERAAMMRYCQWRAGLTSPLLIDDGNSFPRGARAQTSLGGKHATILPPTYKVFCAGRDGQTIVDMVQNSPERLAPYLIPGGWSTRKIVVMMVEGTNEMAVNSSDAETTAGLIKTYCDTIKAMGDCKIIATDVIARRPDSVPAGFETSRKRLNELLEDNPSKWGLDGLYQISKKSSFVQNGTGMNVDNIHPDDGGTAEMAVDSGPMIVAAIESPLGK